MKNCVVCKKDKDPSLFKVNRDYCMGCSKEYYALKRKNNQRKYSKKYYDNVRKITNRMDKSYKLKVAIRDAAKRCGISLSENIESTVGISPKEFWRRNGSPTQSELSNLHVDHIVPLSWFNLEDPDHLKVCNHWTNLQYLTKEDNLRKGNKYVGRPDAVLSDRKSFNIDMHVNHIIEFIDAM